MTQPPLSRQVKVLERILGVTLFERSSRLVRLTPAGRAFLLDARRILRLSESATLATRRIGSGNSGTIALGFTAASGYGLLPRLLTLARAQLPHVDLMLREMVTGEQVEALLTGRLDVGVLRPPLKRSEFDSRRIVAKPLVAALPSGDPRLARSTLELADFHRAPLIMYAPEGAGYFHGLLAGLFNAAGVAPNYVQNVTQIHSMLALVQSGLGAALVPEAAMNLRFSDVHFRAVATDPAQPAELYLSWRRDSDNPVLADILAVWAPVPIEAA